MMTHQQARETAKKLVEAARHQPHTGLAQLRNARDCYITLGLHMSGEALAVRLAIGELERCDGTSDV